MPRLDSDLSSPLATSKYGPGMVAFFLIQLTDRAGVGEVVRDVGTAVALSDRRMATSKTNHHSELNRALKALKHAILQGATWRYEQLVHSATQAGATDEQIDAVAHEAVETLLARAEQPLTPRVLAQTWPADNFRP